MPSNRAVSCITLFSPLFSLRSNLAMTLAMSCLLISPFSVTAQTKNSLRRDTSPLPKASVPVQADIPAPPPMRYVPGMEEPLVATGPVTEQESRDLDTALTAFHDAPAAAGPGSDYDDYAQPLLAFIALHPSSNWNAALYTNIGLGYYNAGYYSRTFGYFEKAWVLGRNATTPQAHNLIDRAVTELADMHARLGHEEALRTLLADLGERQIGGSAHQKMDGPRNGLRMFRSHPELSYLCGPNALRNLLVLLKANPSQIKLAEDARSGPAWLFLAGTRNACRSGWISLQAYLPLSGTADSGSLDCQLERSSLCSHCLGPRWSLPAARSHVRGNGINRYAKGH